MGINGYQYINDSMGCMICDDSCTSCDEPRVLPWAQDLDSDKDGQGDVWRDWDATLRDLIILDRDGIEVARVNLTPYNPDPAGIGSCTGNYEEIKQIILTLRSE